MGKINFLELHEGIEKITPAPTWSCMKVKDLTKCIREECLDDKKEFYISYITLHDIFCPDEKFKCSPTAFNNWIKNKVSHAATFHIKDFAPKFLSLWTDPTQKLVLLKYIMESEQFKKQKGAKQQQQQQQSPTAIKTFNLHDGSILYCDCNFNPAPAAVPPVVRFILGTEYDK